MDKFIEVNLGNQIDRYHIINISVDDFIDTFLTVSADNVKDISEEEYMKFRHYRLEFNVEDKFEVEHYTLKFPNEETRKEWISFIRDHRKFLNKLK